VVQAHKGDLVRRQSYLGIVEAERRTAVAARITATIESVLCDEGDRVEKDQTLINLDDQEVLQDIAGVKAQIEEAQANHAANEATVNSLRPSVVFWRREAERNRKLFRQGTISASEAEAAEDKAVEAQGRLDAAVARSRAIGHAVEALRRRQAQMETRRGYYMLRSPYEGLVTRRLADPGDLAVPGKTLLVIEGRESYKIAFDVPQRDLAGLTEGLPATFRVGGDLREASLTHLYPTLDEGRMLRAEVRLEGGVASGLVCGAYVPIEVRLGSVDDAIVIPASCILEGPDTVPHVFVVKQGTLEPREVEVLASSGREVAVRGIQEGEDVVMNTFLGWARLSSGIPVEAFK